MKKVVMTVTAEGSEDGIHLWTYNARQVYDMAERLAEIFVDQMRVARYVTDAPAPAERKVVGPAETKVVAPEEVKAEETPTVSEPVKPKRRSRK